MLSARQRARSLLDWYGRHARELPWRRTRDPYAVWVSEVMLQQTQVKTVIPYWERWMAALPTVKALADAPEAQVLKLWEGLGYYRRARNLQAGARQLVSEQGGRFPGTVEEMLLLPGVGRYTAGAVCSIAYDQPAPILDGNVTRVLARLEGIREPVRAKPVNDRLWNLAEALVKAADGLRPTDPDPSVPANQARPCSALNQALMELGATVCTPRNPCCGECPWARVCAARRDGLTDQLPNLGARVPSTARHVNILVLRRGQRWLLRQRPAGGVNGGLWEFPNEEASKGEAGKPPLAAPRADVDAVGGGGETPSPWQRLGTVRYSITRYRYAAEVWCALWPARLQPPAGGTWHTAAEVETLPLTAAHRRVWREMVRPAAAERPGLRVRKRGRTATAP